MKKLFALSLISILCMPLHAQTTLDYKENTVNSSCYGSIDGVLYILEKKWYIENYEDHYRYIPCILVRYPSEKTNSTFEIPETVSYIAPHAFKGNKYLKTIIFPSCFSADGNTNEYLKISTTAFDDTAIEEFITKGAATSISSARVNKKGSDKKYNLQGMEINSPQKGEVYIQDGKKYVV